MPVCPLYLWKQVILDVNGVPSTFVPLNKGVSQDSVGPLLFSLFMNDIADEIDPVALNLIHADDL